ncbi:GntR family transcriptional regulator [Limnobaculum zhutongyuii]|uniref:GntR family transcriptional regulator n=1 Tax=Limnobaculum zhutongyuii TaxID=2498113 RepID=A0A411WQI6_9GAMM|nr:GntR family transcriptional regulator [Limnobaculum zhutongyuii]QBH98457.1 GntR family transcriptional regulator [Limnobaculum zhutongyuii]TQS89645.1 GntR family transcriptional regulator [Limnobaculum zhutongyuii]
MKTKAKTIYFDLKHRILSGELKADTRLVIHQLAGMYDSSDIPVREALKELAAEDLIEMSPHKGSRVKRLSVKEMQDMLEIRKTLEPLAARLAAENSTPELVDELEKVYEKSVHMAQEHNYTDYSNANREFHQLIVEASDNTYLKKLLSELLSNERRTKTIFDLFPDVVDMSLQEHREMIQLIAEKKGKEMAELMLKHKSRSYDKLNNYFSNLLKEQDNDQP